MRYIKRNPFAHINLVRKHDYDPASSGCDQCGQERMTRGSQAYLYRYGRHHDSSNKIVWDDHCFCCIGCFRTYHDIPEA